VVPGNHNAFGGTEVKTSGHQTAVFVHLISFYKIGSSEKFVGGFGLRQLAK
jgi:hypothetical protein